MCGRRRRNRGADGTAMESTLNPWPQRRVRLAQWSRRLFKATVWNVLTAMLDRAGLTLATVQVLCIDAQTGHLLLLRTREHACGYGPVQGLCRGALRPGRRNHTLDVREEGRRELLEEAVMEAPPLAEFRIAERYREGPYQQFDCTVLMVLCPADALPLPRAQCRSAHAEGRVVALRLVQDHVVHAAVLDDWREDPDSTPAARDRRFLIGPAEPVHARVGYNAWLPELHQLWPMALGMLASARELGRRDAAAVYQSNPELAAELWRGMSSAARDCFRPDPRLWRDCRLLPAGGVAELHLLAVALAEGEGVEAPQRIDRQPRHVHAETDARRQVQQRTGVDAFEQTVELRRGKAGRQRVVRSDARVAVSDVLFYAMMSARYLPIPVFHTHPTFRTPLGYKQPSPADFWLMGSLHYRLDGAPVGDAVFFPDGTWTEYAITGHDQCAFRRAGDPLLPPTGEPGDDLHGGGAAGAPPAGRRGLLSAGRLSAAAAASSGGCADCGRSPAGWSGALMS